MPKASLNVQDQAKAGIMYLIVNNRKIIGDLLSYNILSGTRTEKKFNPVSYSD